MKPPCCVPKNKSELRKSLWPNDLNEGEEYTLYTSNKEPYKVIFLGPGRLTLPGLECTCHHRKEQLSCWKGAKVYFDNKEKVEIWIDPCTMRAVVADPVVLKRNWCESGHKALLRKRSPPRPQQETVSLTVQVANPWRIASFEKSGNYTVAKITDGGHTLNVGNDENSDDNIGSLNSVKLELDSGLSEPPQKVRKL